MKSNGHNGRSDAAMAIHEHRFERVVILYFDAEGLKRGFQFWMGWPGANDHGCNYVPVYLARDLAPPRGLDELLRAVCHEGLVLLCLTQDGAFSHRNEVRLADVLARDSAEQRGLVVLFAARHSCAAWRRRWPVPEDLAFSLGSYTACPARRARDDAGEMRAHAYELRPIQPNTHSCLPKTNTRSSSP